MIAGLGRLLAFEGARRPRRSHCKLQVSRHSLRTVSPFCLRLLGTTRERLSQTRLARIFAQDQANPQMAY